MREAVVCDMHDIGLVSLQFVQNRQKHGISRPCHFFTGIRWNNHVVQGHILQILRQTLRVRLDGKQNHLCALLPQLVQYRRVSPAHPIDARSDTVTVDRQLGHLQSLVPTTRLSKVDEALSVYYLPRYGLFSRFLTVCHTRATQATLCSSQSLPGAPRLLDRLLLDVKMSNFIYPKVSTLCAWTNLVVWSYRIL